MIDLMGTEPQKEVPIDHYHHVSRGLIERSLARLDLVPQVPRTHHMAGELPA